MIIRISCQGFEPTEDLTKYVHAKLDTLDKYIVRADRPAALAEVALTKTVSGAPERACELRVKLKPGVFYAKETTQHLYAALDIAVADVERQLRAYRRRNPSSLRRAVRRATKQTGGPESSSNHS